jgi:dATP pyrophosphohydrolase
MQVVVFPFRVHPDGTPEYGVFQRSDNANWQPIAGGAEGSETAVMAARREAMEEARIPFVAPLYQLQSMDTVPVVYFRARDAWPADLYVVPQYSFAADVTGMDMRVSHEHTRFEWLAYDQATTRLAFQSNETALWELNERLRRGDLPAAAD